MSRALWIVQGLLALLFLFAGGMKLVLPMEQLEGSMPMPGAFLRFIGVAEVLGAIGLILPALLRIQPWLTPAAYISDPNNLSIKLWVNGVLKQDSNTSKMVHSTAEQIAYLSRHITLQPGDVIATGTPSGVGLPKGEFLKPGDEVKIEIAELGTLTNRMVADAA